MGNDEGKKNEAEVTSAKRTRKPRAPKAVVTSTSECVQVALQASGQDPLRDSKAAKKNGLPTRKKYIPEANRPKSTTREALSFLVRQHYNTQQTKVQMVHWCTEKKFRQTGETIQAPLQGELATRVGEMLDAWDKKSDSLVNEMKKELKNSKVWDEFLSEVFCVGPITAAYLIAYVDIGKSTKPSNLLRYCGVGVMNGRLEKRTESSAPKTPSADGRYAGGGPGTYNDRIRPKLFSVGECINKNKAGGKSKLTSLYVDYLYRMRTSERYYVRGKDAFWIREGDVQEVRDALDAGAKVVRRGEAWLSSVVLGDRTVGKIQNGARNWTYKTAIWKTLSVFVQDMYIVWRFFEGLDIWPTYTEAKMGFRHGGVPLFSQAPRQWSRDEIQVIIDSYKKAEVDRDYLDKIEFLKTTGANREESEMLEAAE